METRIWSKTQEKWADVLVLRGHEVSSLRVTGNMLTLKRNVKAALEALAGGAGPGDVGAKSVKTLDARTITRADIDPDQNSLTLVGGPDDATKVSYGTGDGDAGPILQEVLAASGKTFQAVREPIGVVEALLPPALFGGLGGIFWVACYMTARDLAAGETVEAKGRRRGLKQLLITVSETLGVNGTIAVGVVLLALVLGWAAMRVVRRPERTVWRPEGSTA